MVERSEGRRRAEAALGERADLNGQYATFADAAPPMAPVSGVTPPPMHDNMTGVSEDIDNAVLLEEFGRAPGGTV